jgi:hypothetical protein
VSHLIATKATFKKVVALEGKERDVFLIISHALHANT